MKIHLLRFENGETAELRELGNGSWACPICGAPWKSYPPYSPSDGNSISDQALGDVCSSCNVEIGVDLLVAEYSQMGAMKKGFALFRKRWLERVSWSDQALAQLRDNLGMSEEQVRREAAELETEGSR